MSDYIVFLAMKAVFLAVVRLTMVLKGDWHYDLCVEYHSCPQAACPT